MSELYSVGGSPAPERADAARNRVRVLAAAQRLFARDGIDNVSLDSIAAEAGVGKGTVFRRFGHKAGLAVALLDQRERELQQAVLSGRPPLGPGASAAERMQAFFDAYLEFLEANLELVRLSETAQPGARYRVGSYGLWHRHVVVLISQIRPQWDAEYVAHALLAPLAADLNKALTDKGMSFQRVRDGMGSLLAVVATAVPDDEA